jgi:natural product precursor
MKKLKKLNLKDANLMTDGEMKMVTGGYGGILGNACRIGATCTVYDPSDGSTRSGSCQGVQDTANGSVSCYCDAYGVGSGSGNSSGMSKCFNS